jgi:putative endonuclease
MYYTYILISKNGKKTYAGSTDNIERRLSEHNSGKVKSSRHYIPYMLLHLDESPTLVEARRKERFYKSTSGRRILKNFVEDWGSAKKRC